MHQSAHSARPSIAQECKTYHDQGCCKRSLSHGDAERSGHALPQHDKRDISETRFDGKRDAIRRNDRSRHQKHKAPGQVRPVAKKREPHPVSWPGASLQRDRTQLRHSTA